MKGNEMNTGLGGKALKIGTYEPNPVIGSQEEVNLKEKKEMGAFSGQPNIGVGSSECEMSKLWSQPSSTSVGVGKDEEVGILGEIHRLDINISSIEGQYAAISQKITPVCRSAAEGTCEANEIKGTNRSVSEISKLLNGYNNRLVNLCKAFIELEGRIDL
jgi:hypothetical protein